MNDLRHLQDVGLEAVVLGTILRDGEHTFNEVAPILSVDDFVMNRHKEIWLSAQRLSPEVSVGIESVAHDLMERNKLESIGGFSALVDVDAQGIPGVKLSGFARELRAKSSKRHMVSLAAKLTLAIESQAGDRTEIPTMIDQLRALAEGTRTGGTSILSINELPGVGDSIESIEYILEPDVPKRAVVGLTGDSESGKSTLATAWVRDANAQGIPALVLDREMPRALALERMSRLGLTDSPLLRWYGGWNGEAPSPTSTAVVEWVRSCDPKPLVVIDSLVAFLGGDENDASVMRAFMNGARQLADLGATVIVIHHDGKSTTAQDFRGSSDWKAAVDQAFHVTNISPNRRLDRLSLRCYKSRYGFTGPASYLYAGGRFLRDDRADTPTRTAADQLTEILRLKPGIGSREFDTLAAKRGIGRSESRDFLRNGVLVGSIRLESGPRNQKRHFRFEAGG